MHQCLYCRATERQIKVGSNRAGTQLYQCRECDRHDAPEPKLNGYPEGVKEQAILPYLEGTNFPRIGRLLGVNYQSAVNWVNAYHQSLPVDELGWAAPEVVELDEVFTFSGSKNASLYHYGGRPRLALHPGTASSR
jgi:hypothetical protein